MYKVGLIGVGMSGVRFIRAIQYLYETKRLFRLVGIYDKKGYSFMDFSGNDVKLYDSLQEFSQGDYYDLVIIAASENSHFDLLVQLNNLNVKAKKILIEKPLTENLDQLKQVSTLYGNNHIVVHYVERCSEIITKVKNFIEENGLKIRRMTFSWGKNRLYDDRPTTGVTSEIVHPIDLCLYLGDMMEAEVRIVSGNYISSDYSISGNNMLETVDIVLLVNNDVIISGNSSFLLASRRREMTLYLVDEKDHLWMISMYFDYPRWDIDGYIINKINIDGSRNEIINYQTDNGCIPQTLCMTKIVEFLKLVADEISGVQQPLLPHIDHSLSVQRIIEDINKNSESSITGQVFGCNKKMVKKNVQMVNMHFRTLINGEYHEIIDNGF